MLQAGWSRSTGHPVRTEVSIAKSLYICYSGISEPLVQTQFLPYIREIVKGGTEVHFLTFEPNLKNWNENDLRDLEAHLLRDGIKWHRLPYHKWPSVPATIYDVLRGSLFSWKLIRSEKIGVLHGRLHVATLMAVLAKKFSSRPVRVLFDIRGLMPEEYTDGGLWKPDGLLYKAVKRTERWLLNNSDGFVVLTEKARDIFFPESRKSGRDANGRPVEVIPCCVDFERFDSVNSNSRDSLQRKLNIGSRLVIAYVGSFGSNWYMPKELSEFLGIARQSERGLFALILTQTSPDLIWPLLRKEGFSSEDVFIEKVSPADVPKYLSVADIAVSFIRPCYSKLGSSPTKNAEYLAAGLPMITNSGVGDTAEITREDNVGYVIDEFGPEEYQKAFTSIMSMMEDNHTRERCRVSARSRFDMQEVAGVRYRRIYEALLNS